MDQEEGRIVVTRRADGHPVDAVYGVLGSDRSTDELVALLRGDPEDAA